MKKKIEYDRQCKSCGGTGVYCGLAERDGAGVICYSCNGNGKQHIVDVYTVFEGKKKKTRIKRVYEISYKPPCNISIISVTYYRKLYWRG
jgi:DnaJ-class molecular chaperone